MSSVNCISQRVKFGEISSILEKVKAAGGGTKRDEILRRYFDSFEQFRCEFQRRNDNQGGKIGVFFGELQLRSSIFPVLRLLLPGADRERDSYGVRVKSLRDLYIKVLGISESSAEARKLYGYDDETGGLGAGGASSEDFADRIFRLMQGRCPQEGSLTVWDVNERLDAIGRHYQNGERRKIQDELERMVMGMSQLDQKWLIRILLKNLRLGMSQQKILGVYHARAGQLYDRFSNLSKVCEVVESGEGLEELEDRGGVELFHPVKPMLCQRVDLKLVDGMLKKDEFWLETKMDGERFQLHKDGQVFKYFSRNSYEYSHVFGENRYHAGSTLTPFLADLLSKDVHSIILDGEMMVFDKGELTYRDKSENTDVKSIKSENPTLRPCFCVYDVLFLNGKSLIAVPYAERIRLMGTLVKTKIGVLTSCKRIKVQSSEHLVELLNQAIDTHQEGVVIKKQDSTYSPNERNAGWYKIKPDYIDNMVSDFDLLIIGGIYNSKRTYVNTFLVGILDKSAEEQYLAVTKVGIGLSIEQWKSLNASLRPHWRDVIFRREGRSKISEEPPGLRWGQTPPDVWIPPKHSIVLQLKGSELVRTSSFATSYTIRFPRITAIRSDKTYQDVCTSDEFAQLCSSNTTVAKLAKRHVTASDLVPGSTSSRKRKQISPLKPRRAVAAIPVEPEEDAAPPIDDICSGLDFCVLSTSKGLPTIQELESMIRRHGGRTVKNPGPKTYAVIAGDLTFLVSRIIETRRHNVATIDWALKTLGGPEPRKHLLDFTPNDLLAATDELREKMADQFDRFGDSLTQKIADPDELRTLLKQINVDGTKLASHELRSGQREILGAGSPFRIFRGLVARLYEHNLKEDLERYRARFGMLKFVRNGGQWVAESEDTGVTHVFVMENQALDKEGLSKWFREKKCDQASVVRLEWVEESLRGKRFCDEKLYTIL